MKIGRNDPCPCGSGKKYKRCCLERDRAAAAEGGQRRWTWLRGGWGRWPRGIRVRWPEAADALRRRLTARTECAGVKVAAGHPAEEALQHEVHRRRLPPHLWRWG
ncbi:MAG TPA: SEC-C metal-binding domain-containing protein [Thermoanaerobaculia bacterium]|nr:SEC-C metal-binding domain-containing protein [Thermoanaerobaculia bacterium]